MVARRIGVKKNRSWVPAPLIPKKFSSNNYFVDNI